MLRSAMQADLDLLIALARQPAVARTLAFDAASRLALPLEPESGELLVIEDDGAFAGGVRWTYLNHRSRIAEIRTLMLDPAAHGRGLATAAVLDLVERLINAHDMHRIEAEVLGFNGAAQNVFERAGFLREGVRRRAYDREGDWQDGVRFALLADERV
jgi:RimJ/RimL family protein N-acetyltransferase